MRSEDESIETIDCFHSSVYDKYFDSLGAGSVVSSVEFANEHLWSSSFDGSVRLFDLRSFDILAAWNCDCRIQSCRLAKNTLFASAGTHIHVRFRF